MQTDTQPRFDFGENWAAFSKDRLDDARLRNARESLCRLLDVDSLAGLSFLDIGCGSGLFAIAALALGADPVVGIDINPVCVTVSQENEQRLLGTTVCRFAVGSALDRDLPAQLGQYDIVYAWGSLHHTGAMWSAVEVAAGMVKPGGRLVLGIYNRHVTSPAWRQIKRLYVHLPNAGKRIVAVPFGGVIYLAKLAVTRRNPLRKERGMDFWYDVIDWIGGYPYEYASPREVQNFAGRLDLSLERYIPAQVPTGCNEFVFRNVWSRDATGPELHHEDGAILQ